MRYIHHEKILIFFWICILVSINSSYTSALEIANIRPFFILSETSFFIFANFVRFFLPFIILPILIVFFLVNSTKKIDIFTFIFIIYFCWQLFAFFYSNRQSDSYTFFSQLRTTNSNIFYSEFEESLFTNLNLIFCSLSILIIITIANNLNLKKFNKKIFIVTLFFIGLIAIYFTSQLINESIKNNTKFVYTSGTLMADSVTFFQANPRITGASRMVLIFYFLSFFFFLKSQKKIFWYITLTMLLLLLYKMQTRGSFIGIIILNLCFFLFNSLTIKKKILNLLVLILVPIIIFETYYYIKTNSNFIKTTNGNTNQYKIENKNRLFEDETSGRTTIWKNALFIINEKKIILGYGPQADRFLFTNFRISHKDKNIYYDKNGNPYLYDNNASNSLIYAYLCGGVVGIFLLLSIYLLATFLVIKNIFIKKIFLFNGNLWVNFSTILMIYLGFRGIFENSISVFGLDYIFFVLTYVTCKDLAKSNNSV